MDQRELIRNLSNSQIECAMMQCGNYKDFAKFYNVNYTNCISIIKVRIKQAGFAFGRLRTAKCWSLDQIQILKSNYNKGQIQHITRLLPKRTWDAIKLQAVKIGINREYNYSRKSDLEILLNQQNQSYYWIGFLLADGHFTQKRVTVGLSIKDSAHVQKFCKFTKNTGRIRIREHTSTCAMMDAKIVPKIRHKFGITNRKTYQPSKINQIDNDNLFISLLIGFIDGDGCIKKQANRDDYSIHIKCHSSWLNNLNYMKNRISKITGIPSPDAKLNKLGYANLSLTNFLNVRFLKIKTIQLDLPVLNRKWGIINQNKISRIQTKENNLAIIKELIKSGKSQRHCAEILRVSQSYISKLINKDKQ